jgi:hypothetical protein
MIAAEDASAALFCLSIPLRKPLYGVCFPTLDTPGLDSHVMDVAEQISIPGFAPTTIRHQQAITAMRWVGQIGTLWRLRKRAGCVQGGKTKGTGHDDC